MKEKNKKLTNLDILGIILTVVFLPVIIINMTLVIKGMINPEEVPMIFNRAPLIVISDSMTIDKEAGTGEFNKNDLIIIKKVDPSSLEKGDVVTYKGRDGDIITHRITDLITDKKDGVEVPAFETKGDYSPGYDFYPVTYDQIVGEYLFRLPKLGGIAMFLQTPAGVIVILLIPVIIVFAVDFFIKRKQQKSSDSKNAELEAEIARLKALQAEQQNKEKEQLNEQEKEESNE
jgi:signal peptidase